MKLTYEILCKYPNARVYYADGESYEVVGMSKWEGNLQVVTRHGDTDWWNIDLFQLILTPIDKINDEDAVEVAKMLDLQYSNTDDNYFLDLTGMADYLSEMYSNENRFGDRATFWQVRNVSDYLLSRNYDLYSLIAAGVAVENEKI